jgi:hypothetical protein
MSTHDDNTKMLINMLERQGEIKNAIGRVEENLKEHMRRTANVEGQIAVLWSKHGENSMKIAKAQGAIALLSLLSLVAGLTISISKILS